MKKILSLMTLMTFMAILFVASDTHAAPYLKLQITNMKLNRMDDTLHLFTTLTNVGDQDAEVYQLKFKSLKFIDENGNALVDFQDIDAIIKPCYVQAGCHVNNVEWILDFPNGVPNYKGKTKFHYDDAIIMYEAVE